MTKEEANKILLDVYEKADKHIPTGLIAKLEEVMKVYEELEDQEGIADVHLGYAKVYIAKGNASKYRLGIEHANKALKTYIELDEKRKQIACLEALLELDLDEDRIEGYINTAHKLFIDLDDEYGYAKFILRNSLGPISFEKEHFIEKEALEIMIRDGEEYEKIFYQKELEKLESEDYHKLEEEAQKLAFDIAERKFKELDK